MVGSGQTFAAVEFSASTAVSYDAIAAFDGPNSLPHLRAQSSAGINIDLFRSPRFLSGATARSMQQFTYIGSAPSDYTLEYDINGQVAGGLLTEIASGFMVFGGGFNPNQEVQPVLGFVFDHVNGDGSEKQALYRDCKVYR